MGIKDLLDLWLVLEGINVPDLEFASKSADKQVVFVNLIEVSGVLLVVNLHADALFSGLDVYVADQNLLVVEA